MSFESFLIDTQNRVQHQWREYLKLSDWHEDFKALALNRVAQGKCLRPALVVSTYQSLTGSSSTPPASLLKCALALEMVHTYSLVHDDLPCMDDDNFRRGLPTAHREASEATALLLGDALLTGAFELLATLDVEPSAKVKLIQKLAYFAGGAGMVSGQQRDLHSEIKTVDDLKILHEEKTGALFSYCVWAGALLAESPAEFKKHEDSYLNFGKKMGLLFQVVDDVLDDGEEGASFVKFLGLSETKEYAEALHKELSRDAQAVKLGDLSVIIDRFLNRST